MTERIFPQPTSVRIPFDDNIRESFKILTEVIADEATDDDGKIVRKWSKHYLIKRQST